MKQHWMMHRNTNYKMKSTRSTKGMAKIHQTISSDHKDPQDTDSKEIDSNKTEMADTQTTASVTQGSLHPVTKAQW